MKQPNSNSSPRCLGGSVGPRHPASPRPAGRVLGTLAVAAALLGACAQRGKPLDEVTAYTKALDAAYGQYESYGTIVMSNPLLTKPGDTFAFDLSKTKGGADNHFNAAKTEIQGAASDFTQIVTAFGLGVGATANRVEADNYRAQLADSADSYRVRLADYAEDRRRIAARDALLASAAEQDYTAALEAASKIEDKVEREKKIAEAKRKYAADLPKPVAENPVFPTATLPAATVPEKLPDPKAVVGSAEEARKALADEKSTKFKGLVEGKTPTVTNRSALITSAGDTAVEAIFSVLGRPDVAGAFPGALTLMAVSQVSVIPGAATQYGHVAQLSGQVSLTYQRARPEIVEALLRGVEACKDEKDYRVETTCAIALSNADPDAVRRAATHPGGKRAETVVRNATVVAVSPMTDIQTLDLATGARRRSELSLALGYALAGAGSLAQANAFFQFAKQQEKDFVSRTPDVPIVSYATGNTFGYQVGPLFRAAGDLTAKSLAPEYRLTRQSFPVLLLMRFAAADLRPYVECDRVEEKDESIVDPNLKDCWVLEPHIQVTQTPDWQLQGPGTAVARSRITDLRMKSSDLKLAQSRAESWCRIEKQKKESEESAHETEARCNSVPALAARKHSLQHFLYGSEYRQAIPSDVVLGAMAPRAVAKFTAVLPEKLAVDREASGAVKPTLRTVTYLGEHLDSLDPGSAVVVSGVATHKQSVPRDGTLRVDLEVRSDTEPIVLAYRRKDRLNGEDVLVTPRLDIAVAPKRAAVIRRILPETTTVNPDCDGSGQPSGSPTKVVMFTALGDFLDTLDPSKVTGIAGDATVTNEGGKLIGAGADGIGGAFQWKARVPIADGALAFSIGLKAESSAVLEAVVTPPVVVTAGKCPNRKP